MGFTQLRHTCKHLPLSHSPLNRRLQHHHEQLCFCHHLGSFCCLRQRYLRCHHRCLLPRSCCFERRKLFGFDSWFIHRFLDLSRYRCWRFGSFGTWTCQSCPFGRSRRSAPVEQLAAIDNYFATIADMDVDDCGKLLVCQLESIPREERTPEEGIIAGLFGESSTIDPASAKAEYDLAAYLGQATRSKVACARRYSRCPLDRKTISQALAKMARIPQQ